MDGINYKVRETKTFSNYRVSALKLEKLWNDLDFELNNDLKKQINKEIIQHKKEFNEYQERIKTEDPETVANDYLEILTDLFTLNSKLIKDTRICKEIFLLSDNKKNAKELCKMYFEDCDFDHDKEMNDEEYNEYMTWLLEAFDSFFLKVSGSGNTVSNTKKDSTSDGTATQI